MDPTLYKPRTWTLQSIIPALERLKQEDHHESPGCRVRFCLKTNKSNKYLMICLRNKFTWANDELLSERNKIVHLQFICSNLQKFNSPHFQYHGKEAFNTQLVRPWAVGFTIADISSWAMNTLVIGQKLVGRSPSLYWKSLSLRLSL